MKQATKEDNPKTEGGAKLEQYRLAIRDARHVFNTYKNTHPDDAWETIRRIIFSDKLK